MSNIEQWAKEALLHSNAKPGDAARELLRQAEAVGQNPHLVRVLREVIADVDGYDRLLTEKYGED